MPLADFDGIDEVQNGVEVQEHGPAILSPAAILQNLVEKSNEFISEHRNWLARFPQRNDEATSRALSTVTPPTSTNPTQALITPPPSLELRAPQFLNCVSQLCDCTPQVTAATASLGSILSASIIRLQSNFANASSLAAANSMSLDSAKLQLAGFLGGTQAAASSAAAIASSAALVQASANAAVSAAQTSAALQISAVQSAAQISVGSAVAAASAAQLIASSANSLVLIAQSSASSAAIAAAVASASAQQILASANSIAASANSIASDAKGTISLLVLCYVILILTTNSNGNPGSSSSPGNDILGHHSHHQRPHNVGLQIRRHNHLLRPRHRPRLHPVLLPHPPIPQSAQTSPRTPLRRTKPRGILREDHQISKPEPQQQESC